MRSEACGPMMWAPSSKRVPGVGEGPGVGEDLHQAPGVLQRPAVGGVAVRAGRGDVAPSPCLQVLLRGASRGDLRIGEHSGRRDWEGSFPGLAGVRNVVPDDPRLGVCHALELEVVCEVAERLDPRDARLHGVVGADVSVGVDLDSGRGDVESAR